MYNSQFHVYNDGLIEFRRSISPSIRTTAILILCGAFQSTCEFLFQRPTTKVHSIHLAIYLNGPCLLGLTSLLDECMIIVARSSQQNRNNSSLNSSQFIESYRRKTFLDRSSTFLLEIDYLCLCIDWYRKCRS